MHFWRAVPFLRPLAGLMAGMLVGAANPAFWSSRIVFAVLLLLLLLGFSLLRQSVYRKRWQFGIWVLTFFFVMGAWHRAVYPAYMKSDFVGNLSLRDGDLLLAEALEWPHSTQSERSLKVLCRVVKAGGQACSGLFLAYLPKSDSLLNVRAGSLLLLPARLREIPPPRNPFAFDYRAYMANKQVYHQVFARSGECTVLGVVRRPWYAVLAFRQKLLGVLKKYLHREEALAVVSAMVLGERAYMSAELKESYARSGAMHVLAVSGLHMGLIYFFMLWLFDRLGPRIRQYKGLRFLAGMMGLWGFALLTGASPSVLRAATLFSFILAGKWIQESPNTFNSLAASAFCLLWYNPLWLSDLSFQLSYMAILGILLLRRDLFLLWLPRNTALLAGWKLTSVSVAAQLSTAPLGMYYFHRFSNGFWLSSLVVIPAAPVILLGSLLLFLCDAFVPVLAPWLGRGLELLVLAINGFLKFLSHLPAQSVEGIFLDRAQLLCLYVALLFLVLFFKLRVGKYLLLTLTFLLVVQGFSAFRQMKLRQKSVAVNYVIRPGKSLTDVFCAGRRLTFCDSTVSASEERYAVEGMRIYMGAAESGRLDFEKPDSFCLGPFAWRPPYLLAGRELFVLQEEADKKGVKKNLILLHEKN